MGVARHGVPRPVALLDRAGQIELPPVSYVRHNPLARGSPEPARIDTTPIEDRLRNLQPLEFEQVRRTEKEPLWNSLLEEHHYLGYEQPVGEHLKYLVLGARAAGRLSGMVLGPASSGQSRPLHRLERRSAPSQRRFSPTTRDS